MEWLKEFTPDTCKMLIGSIPSWWPWLHELVTSLTDKYSPAEALLPYITCKAVEADPLKAVPVSASFLALGMSVRIFDDLYDRDKKGSLWEMIGPERTSNYGQALQTLSFRIIEKSTLDINTRQQIMECLTETFFAIGAGQDRDIAGLTRNEEEYWHTVELKSGSVYASVCKSGALAGTDNSQYIETCGVYGRHLGRAIQILNDMDSLWNREGKNDLENNKITLPLLYGLSVDHPGKKELEEIVESGVIAANSKKIIAVLEKIETRKFLVWAAMQEREQALKALQVLPQNEGTAAAAAYITGMFGDLEDLTAHE